LNSSVRNYDEDRRLKSRGKRITDLTSIKNKLVVACDAIRCKSFIAHAASTMMIAERDCEWRVVALIKSSTRDTRIDENFIRKSRDSDDFDSSPFCFASPCAGASASMRMVLPPVFQVLRGGWIYRGGMTILRPSTTTSFVMRLAWRIEATGILYFALIPESVSPATTVWMVAAP